MFFKKENRKSILTIISVVAVLLIGTGIGAYYYYVMPNNFLILDVNPSIKIEVNRLNQVTSVDGINADADQMLEGYAITDNNLETVIGEIVDRMILNGYLVDGVDNNILVTTNDDDNSVTLSNLANKALTDYLTVKGITANQIQLKLTITEQEMEQNENGEKSSGKEAIIEQILLVNPSLDKDLLEDMTISELMAIAQENNVTLDVNYYKEGELEQNGNDDQTDDQNDDQIDNQNDDQNDDQTDNGNSDQTDNGNDDQNDDQTDNQNDDQNDDQTDNGNSDDNGNQN